MFLLLCCVIFFALPHPSLHVFHFLDFSVSMFSFVWHYPNFLMVSCFLSVYLFTFNLSSPGFSITGSVAFLLFSPFSLPLPSSHQKTSEATADQILQHFKENILFSTKQPPNSHRGSKFSKNAKIFSKFSKILNEIFDNFSQNDHGCSQSDFEKKNISNKNPQKFSKNLKNSQRQTFGKKKQNSQKFSMIF